MVRTSKQNRIYNYAPVDIPVMSTSPGAYHLHVDGSIEQNHTPACLNNSGNSKQQINKVCVVGSSSSCVID